MGEHKFYKATNSQQYTALPFVASSQMSTAEIKKLLSNLASVGLIQGMGYVLPLITLPYLLNVLGAEHFGLLSISQAITSFFVVLIDFGFNLIGTREAAIKRTEIGELNRLFSNILLSKVILWFIGLLIFGMVVLVIPEYRAHLTLFTLSFGITIGTVLLPVWLFQGLEKFRVLHTINTSYRLVYTVFIFAFIHSKEDINYVAALNSSTAIIGGLVGILWCRKYNIQFRMSSWKEVKSTLSDNQSIFFSSFGVNAVSYAPLILLGNFASPLITGYYAFIDKILLFFNLVIRMLGSITFPILSRGFHNNKLATIQLLKKIGGFGGLIFFFSGIALLIFASPLADFIKKEHQPELENMIRWIAMIPLVYLFRNLSELTLLALYLNKNYSQVILSTAAIHIIFLWILTANLGYKGTIISVYLVEILVVVLSLRIIQNKL